MASGECYRMQVGRSEYCPGKRLAVVFAFWLSFMNKRRSLNDLVWKQKNKNSEAEVIWYLIIKKKCSRLQPELSLFFWTNGIS